MRFLRTIEQTRGALIGPSTIRLPQPRGISATNDVERNIVTHSIRIAGGNSFLLQQIERLLKDILVPLLESASRKQKCRLRRLWLYCTHLQGKHVQGRIPDRRNIPRGI
jgi:hypothetical protein